MAYPTTSIFLTFIAETNTFTMRATITLFLYLLCLTAFSQNYHPFPNPTDTLSFADTNGLVRFVTFDSVSTSVQGSSYFSSAEIGYEPYMDSCSHHVYDTAWYGAKIEVLNDSITFYHSSFSLTFNLNDRSGTSKYAGSYDYYGSRFNFYIKYLKTNYRQTHSGQNDSIKSFEIIVKDTANRLRASYSPIIIEISKNHGLQSFPLLTTVGNSSSWNPNTKRINFNLLTRREIFDFEVGDEYQYRINMNSGVAQPTTHAIHKIISKVMPTTENVVYTVARIYNEFDINTSAQTITEIIHRDTVTKQYGNLSAHMINALSYSPGPALIEWYKNGEWGRDGLLLQTGYYLIMDSCLMMPFEPKTTDSYYAKGLGETRYERLEVDVFMYTYSEKLIYFKKANGATGGTRVNIGLDDLERRRISFYPNPAQNELRFILEEDRSRQVEIFNLSGQLLITSTLSADRPNLNIEDLTPGVYLLKSGKTSAKFVKL